MFEYFSGVSELLIPDNLASGVSKACRYDPEVNPSYRELATHYGTAVLPARPRRPRDKAKAETGVQVAERWILAPLRNHTFFSLTELNREIACLLDSLNDRPFQKLDGTRRSLFESVERPALKPLPTTRYEYARVAQGPSQHRLPHRRREPFLQRSSPPRQKAGGRAPRGLHGGDPPRWPPRGGSRPEPA